MSDTITTFSQRAKGILLTGWWHGRLSAVSMTWWTKLVDPSSVLLSAKMSANSINRDFSCWLSVLVRYWFPQSTLSRICCSLDMSLVGSRLLTSLIRRLATRHECNKCDCTTCSDAGSTIAGWRLPNTLSCSRTTGWRLLLRTTRVTCHQVVWRRP